MQARQQTFVITQTSTLLPLPKSLKMPAQIALHTKLNPSSLVNPSRYFDSKTVIAASEPEPIVANGRISVDP